LKVTIFSAFSKAILVNSFQLFLYFFNNSVIISKLSLFSLYHFLNSTGVLSEVEISSSSFLIFSKVSLSSASFLVFSSFFNSSSTVIVVQLTVSSVILFCSAQVKISFLLSDLAFSKFVFKNSESTLSNVIDFSFVIYSPNCFLVRLLLSTAVISFISSFFVFKIFSSLLYFFTLAIIFLVLFLISVVTPEKSSILKSLIFLSFILLLKAIHIF